MFIIPVGNRVDWKRPPIVTLLLIAINCFVFFFLQAGDDAKDEKAAQYYFSSELPDWELNRYSEYLEKSGDAAKLLRFKGMLEKQDSYTLLIMERDAKFMRELHAGRIITSQAPEFAAWTAQRSKYESMRSFTTRYVYYVDDPSPVNAFTSAFMHGGFDHLFGNMVVLFLVGFLVETVIGKALFTLAYLVSIYASVIMFSLTAHGGSSLGASGAIAGVMGLYTVIFGVRKIDFFYSLGFYFDYVRAPAIALLPLWLGNELYQFLSEQGAHIAYMAHFGGLLSGATIGALYRWKRPALIEVSAEQMKSPTLGFNKTKDVRPVLDQDAFAEETEIKKRLPDNQFVYDKRAMHEAALLREFVDGFQDSKECAGITLYLKSDKKPEFTLILAVNGHDTNPDDQSWTWILGWPGDPSPENKPSHGMGGMGSQSDAKLAARDVCLTIWDDVDPNHFKKPGGKIE